MSRVRSLFATQIFEASLAGQPGFAAFNAELEAACRMLAAEDGAGRAWCRKNGYGGYTSYASLNDLPTRASVFGALKAKLDRRARAFAEALALDLAGGRLKLDSLWVNVLKPGAAHSGHVHPHSVLSGVVNVAVPPGASALRLEDPRLPLMMAAPAASDRCGRGPAGLRLSGADGGRDRDVGELVAARGAGQPRKERADQPQLQLRLALTATLADVRRAV